MFHLAAYYASVNSAGALAQLNAIAEQALAVNNNNIVVPSAVANLLAEAALSAQTSPLSAQVQSPTLRQLVNQDVGPVVSTLKFSAYYQLQWHGDNPRALSASEQLSFFLSATGGAAAGNYGLVWLGDGAIKPTSGKIFTVRCTAAAALAAGAWVNSVLTFPSILPAGTYQIVGMRAEGANLVAARLSFVGGGFRPGVPAENGPTTQFFPDFRDGAMGVFGQFDQTQPPTVDCLGATDTTQVIYLDLIKAS